MNEHLETLNALTRCLQKFDEQALEDFHTVFDTVWPETPEEVLYLAEELRDFTVVPEISSAEEYGWFLITKSEHFDIDPKLEDCIDYQKYGQRRIQEEGGRFGDRGYGDVTIPFVDRFPKGEIYNLLTTRPEDLKNEAKTE